MSWSFSKKGAKADVIAALQSHTVAPGFNLNQFLPIRELVLTEIAALQHEAGVDVEIAGHADEHHRESKWRVVGYHLKTEPEPELPEAA